MISGDKNNIKNELSIKNKVWDGCPQIFDWTPPSLTFGHGALPEPPSTLFACLLSQLSLKKMSSSSYLSKWRGKLQNLLLCCRELKTFLWMGLQDIAFKAANLEA